MMKSTSTMQEDYGPLGIIVPLSRGYMKSHTSKSSKEEVKSGRDGSR